MALFKAEIKETRVKVISLKCLVGLAKVQMTTMMLTIISQQSIPKSKDSKDKDTVLTHLQACTHFRNRIADVLARIPTIETRATTILMMSTLMKSRELQVQTKVHKRRCCHFKSNKHCWPIESMKRE